MHGCGAISDDEFSYFFSHSAPRPLIVSASHLGMDSQPPARLTWTIVIRYLPLSQVRSLFLEDLEGTPSSRWSLTTMKPSAHRAGFTPGQVVQATSFNIFGQCLEHIESLRHESLGHDYSRWQIWFQPGSVGVKNHRLCSASRCFACCCAHD